MSAPERATALQRQSSAAQEDRVADTHSRSRSSSDSDSDSEEEAAANEGAEDTITVLAHVREKLIPVHCGFGTQQVGWLGHVAIARYWADEAQDGEQSAQMQSRGWLELGVPTKVVKDGRRELQLSDIICDVLQDRSHIYVSTSLG